MLPSDLTKDGRMHRLYPHHASCGNVFRHMLLVLAKGRHEQKFHLFVHDASSWNRSAASDFDRGWTEVPSSEAGENNTRFSFGRGLSWMTLTPYLSGLMDGEGR